MIKDFGATLKKYRTQRNMSQENFANKAAIHVTNLSKYERNKSVPSLDVAERMAAVLEVPLDELLHGEPQQQAKEHLADKELLSLFDKTQQLPEEQRKTVVDLLSAFLFKYNLSRQLAH